MNELAWHMYTCVNLVPWEWGCTCVDCVSRVSVSSASLAVEILSKNNKASPVKCRQRPFWSVSVRWGKIRPWKTFLGARSYDCSSQNTEDFAAWCKLVSKECRFNDRAVECEVVRFTKQFFFWTKPKHSLLEQGVKQRDLHDNGRNTIKGGSRETKGQKNTGGGRTGYGKREIVTPRSPPPHPTHTHTHNRDSFKQSCVQKNISFPCRFLCYILFCSS